MWHSFLSSHWTERFIVINLSRISLCTTVMIKLNFTFATVIVNVFGGCIVALMRTCTSYRVLNRNDVIFGTVFHGNWCVHTCTCDGIGRPLNFVMVICTARVCVYVIYDNQFVPISLILFSLAVALRAIVMRTNNFLLYGSSSNRAIALMKIDSCATV